MGAYRSFDALSTLQPLRELIRTGGKELCLSVGFLGFRCWCLALGFLVVFCCFPRFSSCVGFPWLFLSSRVSLVPSRQCVSCVLADVYVYSAAIILAPKKHSSRTCVSSFNKFVGEFDCRNDLE